MNDSESQEILYQDDETLTGCGASLPCDPKRRLHRYLVLFLICFLSFGSYFCYDNPAALEDLMMSDLNLTASSYMSFYSWYSWPNVVLSFIGGFLIDRVFGIRLGAIIFSLFVLAGQFFFAGGAYIDSYYLCVFGRFLFGVGGESLAVAQNTYASSWFKDNELNFIFGLQLSMSRVGSTVNLNTMIPIYNSLQLPEATGHKRLGTALFVASATCVFSLICALVLSFFDKRAEKILKRKSKDSEAEKISLKDIRYFSVAFWLISGICVTYYVAVFPFISLSKVFLIQKSKNSKRLVVLLTNGLSMERVQTIQAAYDLQESGVDIVTIGLGDKADREELKILSTFPNPFLRQDFKEEKSLLEKSVKVSCKTTPAIKPQTCSSNGDIIFVVDKSTDNTNEIWDGIRSLMLTTLQSLNISRTTSRISIIDYSDETTTEFRLDEAFTKRDIYVAIKQLRSNGNGGDLNTALNRARQVFKIDYRADVAKIVVLFTDKLPTNQKDSLSEAEILKGDGVKIIFVGLSKNSPYNFYENLASKKSSIKIENINKIDKNKEQIKNMICDAFKQRQDECTMKKLDVIVTIDKSTSLGPENFQIELDFVNRIVQNLDLRKDRTRIGIFTFNSEVYLNVPIDSNFENADMQKEINKIPFIEGNTAIGWAIGNATDYLFTKGREDVPKVLVVLTDGANDIGESPQISAVKAKLGGIKIISVGVGQQISEKELNDIASSGEFYNVKTFTDLEKFNAKTISNDACQIPQKPTICKAAGDLIFVMGSSANKTSERFKQMSDFMKSLTKLTVVDKENTRVAILKFNRGNYIDSGFKEDYKNFESSIEDMTTSTNGVFIGKALTSARVLFKSDTRKNATKTVIIIIDGEITDRNETFEEANLLKKDGIKVFTIGLTGKTSESDLKSVASPDKALFVDNFSNLQRYNAYISSELCDVIKGTNKECSTKQLDLMFALDSSSSIGPDYWQTELDFVERIVRDMDINANFTKVGVVTFNTDARKEFGLDQFTEKYAMISAVKRIIFDDGATDIGEALRECKNELLNSTRKEVPKVIVLVTDGVSTGGLSPELESTLIKKLGIKIIVIGIGDSTSPSQLKILSSSGTFYRILDFKTLKDYDTTFITRESCKAGKKA